MNLLALNPYVFGTNLTWYSVFILIGAIVTYILSDYFYKKDPESKKCPDLILNTFLLAFPAGIIGARMWYVLSELEYYTNDPGAILRVWEGGLAIQGGVLFGAFVGIVFAIHLLRKNGMTLKITTLMDMIIPNILIAQVIGRWGNFFNREVYGACVDHLYALKNWWMLPNWLVDYMAGGSVGGEYISCSSSQYAQPLFLYEGLLNFIGFILISFVLRKWFKKRVDGTLTCFYLIWYGTVRVCLEPLRNEMFIMRWGKFSQSVITSIAYIVLGAGLLIYFYVKDAKFKKQYAKLSEAEVVKEIEVTEVLKESVEENKEIATPKKTTTKKTVPSTAKKTTSSVKNGEKIGTKTTKTSTAKKTTSTTNKTATTTKKSTSATKKTAKTKEEK